jgi:putative hydrolase of the HAD superfamily
VIRGIAFDLFDTLVDQNHQRLAPVEIESGTRIGATTPALHARLRELSGHPISLADFAALQREVDRELRADTLDRGLELPTPDRFAALAARLECSDVASVAKSLTEAHMGKLLDAVSVPAHHGPILTALALDLPLALCSNFSHAPTARALLESAGLDAHLHTVVISEEVGFRKPRREIFEAVAAGFGLEPREILHVGDNLEADVAGAAAVGMRTVWLTRRVPDPEAVYARYEGPRPDFSLEDLADLPVLIARLNAT